MRGLGLFLVVIGGIVWLMPDLALSTAAKGYRSNQHARVDDRDRKDMKKVTVKVMIVGLIMFGASFIFN